MRPTKKRILTHMSVQPHNESLDIIFFVAAIEIDDAVMERIRELAKVAEVHDIEARFYLHECYYRCYDTDRTTSPELARMLFDEDLDELNERLPGDEEICPVEMQIIFSVTSHYVEIVGLFDGKLGQYHLSGGHIALTSLENEALIV